ncbi:MAG TPA: cation:proton antiporter [Actinocrinis sp.]|jgi:Kef-type K+ transport system membrane component KefB
MSQISVNRAERPGRKGTVRRYGLAYALFVAVPIAAAVIVAAFSSHSLAHHAGSLAAQASTNAVDRVLVAVTAVVALAAACGALARRLGQPAVVGELVGGVALGPSLLGAIAPSLQHWLFPTTAMPSLSVLAQLGVILFMFLIGAELAPGTLRRSGGRAVVIGHGSMAPALLCGIVVALGLRGRYPSAQSGTVPFLLFIGLCFAITAFPVLARVLDEEKLIRTRIGTTGIAAAGIGDITAWCLLALVVAVVRQASPGAAAGALGLVAVFALVMVTVVRPLVARVIDWVERSEPENGGVARKAAVSSGLVCLVLACGLATNAMGVHAIFGAFLAGVVMPRDNKLIKDVTGQVEGVVLWVLLPLFFMTVGLQTNLRSMTAVSWLVCLIVVAIAVAAKFGGTSGAAAAVGERGRTALALGAMMNCRGLTELIVLQLGLQLGVLTPALFSIFVLMTLVTTAMTGPLLRWLLPPEERAVIAFGESLDEFELTPEPEIA